jgi:amino acid adenylation domain-containing protein
VADGSTGELYLGGDGLARGYLGRPDLTAERFVPDSFSGKPGARLYRTGDQARLRPDGELEFLGRLDHQVKIRGFRIEPGEVEVALVSHPYVSDAAVLAREAPGGERRLVAWAEPIPGRPLSVAALREHVAGRLPAHMVPGAFVILESLPRLPNGKIDRSALPDPPMGREGIETPFEPPRTPVEERIAEIWSELTGVSPVGRRDAFLEIGGHSLLAARVAARLRQDLGVELPVHACLEARTVKELATEVEARRGGGASRTPLTRRPRGPQLPLSDAQRRLWLAESLEPESTVYNIPETVRLRGLLDAEVLAGALRRVVRRHEVLGTTFAFVDHEPVQVVARDPETPLVRVDLAGLPPELREPAALSALRTAVFRPFDLASGPLLRAALFRLAEDDHLLLVAVHHVAADGWSLDVLFRELGEACAALARGEEPALPELPVQYADFALWQRDWLEGPELLQGLERWSRRLAGVPALDLPSDLPRPAVRSLRGSCHRFGIGNGAASALRRLGHAEGATPFMTLLAAYEALLARHSGQDDFAVGTPVAGRTHRELEGLIGFFVNLLPLRADLSGSPTGRELLRRVRSTALEAYADQDIPFDRIVEALRIPREPGLSPVFQAVLALEETSVDRRGLPGLEVSRVVLDAPAAKFDLTLFLEPAGEGLRGTFEHRTDLLEPSTVARLARHFARLVAALAEDPDRPVAELPILPEEELRELLVERNRTDSTGDPRPVHLQVAEVAAAAPERPAVTGGGETLAYGELAHRAGLLARHLRRMGVGPDTVVGLLSDRSPSLVVGALAVLQAGGAYLPLDPELPAERMRHMLQDSGALALLARNHLLGRVQYPAVLNLDDAVLFQGEVSAIPEVDPESLAYVIYTSGSTGEPKGVAVSHRGLSSLVAWHRRVHDVRPEDRSAPQAGLSFDAAVWEIWPYLAASACLCMIPEEARLAPARLLEWLAAERVTVCFLPTPVAEMVLAEMSGGPGAAPSGLALRALLTGGDKLSRRRPSSLPFELINHYGPTESSVVATWGTVPVEDGSGQPPTIGRPVDRTRVYILDPGLRPVPLGAAGEICLGGASLARGYLGRPDLTAERFVPDPFGGAGLRLYRTGDLARWTADGELQFLGRIDHQVKVRGMRIEPGEIEACLARCPGVRQAAVAPVPDGASDAGTQPVLAAWIVPAEGSNPSSADLRAWLAERLPAPMVPSVFIRIPSMPLTPNGKLDRRALPIPGQRGESAGPAEAPRTPTEELLLGIWQRVLGRRSIGTRDDFFLLGGHSLLAAQVVSRMGATFGVELPLRALFESPTVAGLAARVEVARASLDVGQLPPLGRIAQGDRAPLSPTQQGLWFLSQLAPESGFYTIPSVLRLRGKLCVPALAEALSNVVSRHEALRTTLAAREDGRPEQVIARETRVPLPVEDLASLPDGERGRISVERIAAEVARPFDLQRGPLLRARLLRLGDAEHVLVLAVHHAVSDGWSMGVLHRELGVCYEAWRLGSAPALPEPPLQYADYAIWQRRCVDGGWIEPQIAFWKDRLAGVDLAALEVPGDRPHPAVRGHRGRTLRTTVPAGLAEAVRELGLREAATPLMVLRAVFETLLFRYTGRDRFVMGSPVAGRQRSELEELIGFFVQVLPIPADVSGRPGFRALLARVREAALAAYEHQDVPFERLVEELRPAREEGRNPLFEVLFAGNPPTVLPELPSLLVERLDVETGTSKFDLTLFVEEGAQGLDLALEHDSERFEAATAARLLDHLTTLLEGAVANPERPVTALPLLREEERRQLLIDWAGAASLASLDRSIPELFEERCAVRPEAVALIAGDAVMTYGELNCRANRVAHRLRRMGVGTDLPVGVCAERSFDLIVALLGILKAGGAYVPLDPSYPRERLLLMMEDARLSVIVGTAPLLAGLPTDGIDTVLLDDLDDETAFACESEESPAAGALPDSLAYILFTSGSTGRPKGVAVPHRGVVRLVRDTNFAEFSEDEVFFQYAPMPFDLSTLEIWGPLLNGARLVLPPAGKLSLEELGAELRRHGVTFLWLTAGLFHLMVDEQLDSLRGVRQLIAGGDVLSVPHVERALAALAGVAGAVINGYGPTENTTFTTCHAMRGSAELVSSVPIGRPIPGTRVVVVDAEQNPVPQGVPGELLTAGQGLARGYFGRPDLTAERFVPDPFSGPGERLYRTGDLARWLPDGTLEFLGRIDQQVKIRGFRIEPGEIETALATHPRVRECVVAARGTGGDRQLAAYAVSLDGESLEPAELRAFLRERLPEHMVPAAFVTLPALPLSPNGKVDRRALPAPEARHQEAGSEPFAAPSTPLEAVLADLWAEVLGVDAAGIHDDFFTLGGSSLQATQLVSRVRQVLRAEVPLRTLLRQPTVAGLAQALMEDATQRDRVERIAELLAGIEDEEDEEEEIDSPLAFSRGDGC